MITKGTWDPFMSESFLHLSQINSVASKTTASQTREWGTINKDASNRASQEPFGQIFNSSQEINS